MTRLAYLALGDSYTIGEGVDEAGRWPLQLAAGLRASGIAIADPRIIAFHHALIAASTQETGVHLMRLEAGGTWVGEWPEGDSGVSICAALPG